MAYLLRQQDKESVDVMSECVAKCREQARQLDLETKGSSRAYARARATLALAESEEVALSATEQALMKIVALRAPVLRAVDDIHASLGRHCDMWLEAVKIDRRFNELEGFLDCILQSLRDGTLGEYIDGGMLTFM